MSELDDAIARLERAVARLEVIAGRAKRGDDERVSAVAAAIAGRLDAAIAKLGQVLDPPHPILSPSGGEDRVRGERED